MRLKWMVIIGAFVTVGSLYVSPIIRSQEGSKVISILPDGFKWIPGPDGSKIAIIRGDLKKQGKYVLRINWPANFKLKPHTHPDERMVTVLSGTYYFGIGERFDESKLKGFPANSIIIVPARMPHFGGSGKTAEIHQEEGTGPTSTDFVDPN